MELRRWRQSGWFTIVASQISVLKDGSGRPNNEVPHIAEPSYQRISYSHSENFIALTHVQVTWSVGTLSELCRPFARTSEWNSISVSRDEQVRCWRQQSSKPGLILNQRL
jgi:hypothetical protein